MSHIQIQKANIAELATDCIVNAANEGLWAGSGVCGAIFSAAGYDELTHACNAIGHCDTGSAVITPGFHLKVRYIIHAVGPIWRGGNNGEAKQLYSCYYTSLALAMANSCHSIAFPLISSGIFGYPKEQAWQVAIQSCRDFIRDHADYDIDITFAVLNDAILQLGAAAL